MSKVHGLLIKKLIQIVWFEGDLQPAEVSFKFAAFWIQIFNLPIKSMVQAVGEDIGNAIGRSLEVDVPESGLGWGRYLRIRVDIEIAQPPLRGKILEFEDGAPFWVDFRYEHLPIYCYRCGIIGHSMNDCLAGRRGGGDNTFFEDKFGPWLRATPVRGGPYRRQRESFSSDDGCESTQRAGNNGGEGVSAVRVVVETQVSDVAAEADAVSVSGKIGVIPILQARKGVVDIVEEKEEIIVETNPTDNGMDCNLNGVSKIGVGGSPHLDHGLDKAACGTAGMPLASSHEVSQLHGNIHDEDVPPPNPHVGKIGGSIYVSAEEKGDTKVLVAGGRVMGPMGMEGLHDMSVNGPGSRSGPKKSTWKKRARCATTTESARGAALAHVTLGKRPMSSFSSDVGIGGDGPPVKKYHPSGNTNDGDEHEDTSAAVAGQPRRSQ